MISKMSILNRLIRADSSSRRKYPDILHSKNWRISSINERKIALEQLEHDMARKQGREPVKIVYKSLPMYNYGQYDHSNRTMVLNNSLIRDPSENVHAIETVIHEGRHAYQFTVTDGDLEPSKFDEAEKWLQNRFYYFPEDTYHRYYYQPIERDAHQYSFEQTKRIYADLIKRYGSDRHYDEFIKTFELYDQHMNYLARSDLGENYLEVIDGLLKDIYETNSLLGKTDLDRDSKNKLILITSSASEITNEKTKTAAIER